MKFTIYLMQMTSCDFVFARAVPEGTDVQKDIDRSLEDTDYVLMTDPVEVEFVPVERKVQVEAILKTLDNAEKSLRATFQVQLNTLDQRRQELLAIEDQSDNGAYSMDPE